MTTQKIKTTVATFGAMKAEGKRISMLTCYDYTTARLIEESSVNAILVGDSLGNVMLGYPDTLAVTVEDMITYGAAVVRGVKNTMVVVDMPFMSYQVTVEDAVRNAGRILKETHCNAVKLEGGKAIRETIERIVAAGIPVMGHVGMTPQSVMQFGGFKVQGRGDEAAERVFQDALAVQEGFCCCARMCACCAGRRNHADAAYSDDWHRSGRELRRAGTRDAGYAWSVL